MSGHRPGMPSPTDPVPGTALAFALVLVACICVVLWCLP